MPIVKNFIFALNTDAETFCSWFEDRNKSWVIGATTGANCGLVEIQKAERAQLKSRTQFSFGAVIEITDEDGEWVKAEKRWFSLDWVKNTNVRRGIYRANVITVMVMPATDEGKVNVRILCNDKDALDGFSRVLTKIAEAYPEARSQLQNTQEEQFIDNPLTPTANILALKRGRKSDPNYDRAYRNIVNGMGQEEAFQLYIGETSKQKPTTVDRRNFHGAMRDRKKKDSGNDVND